MARIALRMLKNTSRWIDDESCSGATAPRIPETAVITAIPRPRMIGINDGLSVRLGVGRLAMAAKPTAQPEPNGKRRPKRLMRYCFDVGLAQSLGHGRQQFVGQPPHLVEETAELPLAEDEQPHVGVGHDGRVPRATHQQGELAEVLARAKGVDLPPVALDRGLALEDEEELVTGRALLDDH